MSINMINHERLPRSERHGYTAITNNVAGNVVYNKGSSEDDDGWCKVATDVAPDVLFTVRFLIQWAAIVAIAVTVGIVLIEIVPPLLVVLSRVVLDLPLAILNSLLVPLLDRLLQLPLAIAHGLLAVAYAVLSVFTSVGHAIVMAVSSIGHGIFWVVSSIGHGVFWVVKSIYHIVEVLCFLLAGVLLLRHLSP